MIVVDEKTIEIETKPNKKPQHYKYECFRLYWRCFPVGIDHINFIQYENETQITWKKKRCFCCKKNIEICDKHDNKEEEIHKKIIKRPCTIQSTIIEFFLSFIFAFLVHLVPSIIWGAENSLGSSSNHAKMGIIWFGLWPIWWILFIYLRPYGLQVNPETFIPISSPKKILLKEKDDDDQSIDPLIKNENKKKYSLWTWKSILAFFLFLFLLINCIVTLILVSECLDRGCCKDDEDTLLNCTTTGYPN